MRCGKQYYFRYIENIKSPPAVAMIQGTSVHKAQELNMRQKIESFADLPTSDVLDCASTVFESEADNIEKWDVDRGEAKDTVISIARLSMETHQPLIQPIEVEATYDVKCGNDTLKVVIDLVDTDGFIRDAKVVGKTKSQSDTDNDLQLSIYSWATRMKDVAFDCHVKTKIPKIVTIKSKRTESDWRKVEQLVPAIIEGINKEVFLPADPTSWACSEKFCGYWHICKFGKGDK